MLFSDLQALKKCSHFYFDCSSERGCLEEQTGTRKERGGPEGKQEEALDHVGEEDSKRRPSCRPLLYCYSSSSCYTYLFSSSPAPGIRYNSSFHFVRLYFSSSRFEFQRMYGGGDKSTSLEVKKSEGE